MTILLAELYLDGGRTVRRFSERFWYSKSTDAIGVQEYVGRVTGWPTYSVRVGCVLWNDQTGVSFGALDIANTDGGASDLLEHSSRDCLCIIRLVEEGQGHDQSVVLARCIIDKIEMQDATMRVTLLGQDSRLDRPLQSRVYPDTLANVQLRGTPRPVTIGPCIQIEPALTYPIGLDYDCADVGLNTLDAVHAGGSAFDPGQIAPNANGAGFITSVTAAARVTAWATGPAARYDDIFDSGGRFNDPSAWAGSTLASWTTSGSGTVTRLDSVGAHFVWPASSFVGATFANANVMPDTEAGWYMITGRITYTQSAGTTSLGIFFRNSHGVPILGEGEFCRFVYVPAGSNRGLSFTAASLGGEAGEMIVESLRVYQVSDISLDDPFVGLIWHIVNRGGLTDDNFDGALLTRPDQSWIRDIGACYHQRDNTTGREALQLVLQSVTGWAYIAPDGFLRIGTVDDVSGTPDLAASKLNMTTWPIYEPDSAPGLSDTYAALKNWSPYSEQELAGITHTDQPPLLAEYRVKSQGTGVLARMYRHGIGAQPIGTSLVLDSASQAEANRITSMHESEWGFWMFSIAFSSPLEAASILPGGKSTLDPDLFGPEFPAGQIIGVDGQFGNNTLALIVRAKRNPA